VIVLHFPATSGTLVRTIPHADYEAVVTCVSYETVVTCGQQVTHPGAAFPIFVITDTRFSQDYKIK